MDLYVLYTDQYGLEPFITTRLSEAHDRAAFLSTLVPYRKHDVMVLELHSPIKVYDECTNYVTHYTAGVRAE